MMKKNKKTLVVMAIIMIMTMISGCSQATRVSNNLTKEADNFNVVRQLTVINCIQGDVIFQMTGRLSVKADRAENQLEVVVEDGGQYKKEIVGLCDNVAYVVDDLDVKDVSNYKFTLNYNPKMWIPVEFENID